MRKIKLGVALVALVALVVPSIASAAEVRPFGTTIAVSDPTGQFADNITVTGLTITNSGGPLTLIPEVVGSPPVPDSGQLSCSQSDAATVRCTRLTGGPPTTVAVATGAGNDTVRVGTHSTNEKVTVHTQAGNDAIDAANGSADSVDCGDGFDTFRGDGHLLDTLLPPFGSCETLTGDGAQQGGGDPLSDPVPPDDPATPVTKLKLSKASAHKGKLVVVTRVSGPGRVIGKATKGKRLLAQGAERATKAGAVTLVLKPTKAAKRLLKHKRAVKVKVKVAFKATGGTVVKTARTRIRR